MTDAADITDLERELYRAATRHLNGHGPRNPTAMLAEIVEELGEVTPDSYGDEGVVAELEPEVAAMLGKPAAVFMTSGTMAQQIALRVHADRTGRDVVHWHPTCHLELHEGQGAVRLHGLKPRPVGHPRRLMTLDDLNEVAEYAAALLLELPQREIGGQLPEWDDLTAQIELARSHKTATHLDGARLLEALPFYDRTAAEVSSGFDSVYVSLYKGLGGLAGCVLAGDDQLVAEAREWRLRHGGRLFQMWPYAASGLAGLRRRAKRIPEYVAHNRAICETIGEIEGVTVIPDPPPTNMAHLHLDVSPERMKAAALRIAEAEGIWSWGHCRPGDAADHCVVEFCGRCHLAVGARGGRRLGGTAAGAGAVVIVSCGRRA